MDTDPLLDAAGEIGELEKRIAELNDLRVAEAEQYSKRINDLEREVDFLAAFADPPDMQTGMTRRDELEQENLDIATLYGQLQKENERLRAECGLRQIHGYREGMERAAEMLHDKYGVVLEELENAIRAEIEKGD